jgi:pimeloyl-ACP methyl ester carboxylesterase
VLGATLDLPDGRVLCFDDVGDPDGDVIVYVHGTPDSRRARHPDDDVNRRAGIRLLAVDRPGSGGSSPHPGGTVGSFADDVATLAAGLGIRNLATLGWSAGAVHALAVPARHPALVSAVGIVAGLPPIAAYAEPGILDAASDDRRAVAELATEMSPDAVGELLAPLVAPHPCDLELAREYVVEGADAARRAELEAVPGALDAMAAGVVDAVAQGPSGLQHDIALQVTAPDIELGDVVCPVLLWYGTLDRAAPPSFGHWFAAHLPDATLDVIDGAGHCLVLPRWAEIVRATAGERRRRSPSADRAG